MDELTDFRRGKDEFFAEHPQSPLTPRQRKAFTGLKYFEYNPELDLKVRVEEDPVKEEVTMQTSTGDVQHYRRYGSFTFQVDGVEAQLAVYASPHGFFVPFVDSLANKETYGAGRYVRF